MSTRSYSTRSSLKNNDSIAYSTRSSKKMNKSLDSSLVKPLSPRKNKKSLKSSVANPPESNRKSLEPSKVDQSSKKNNKSLESSKADPSSSKKKNESLKSPIRNVSTTTKEISTDVSSSKNQIIPFNSIKSEKESTKILLQKVLDCEKLKNKEQQHENLTAIINQLLFANETAPIVAQGLVEKILQINKTLPTLTENFHPIFLFNSRNNLIFEYYLQNAESPFTITEILPHLDKEIINKSRLIYSCIQDYYRKSNLSIEYDQSKSGKELSNVPSSKNQMIPMNCSTPKNVKSSSSSNPLEKELTELLKKNRDREELRNLNHQRENLSTIIECLLTKDTESRIAFGLFIKIIDLNKSLPPLNENLHPIFLFNSSDDAIFELYFQNPESPFQITEVLPHLDMEIINKSRLIYNYIYDLYEKN